MLWRDFTRIQYFFGKHSVMTTNAFNLFLPMKTTLLILCLAVLPVSAVAQTVEYEIEELGILPDSLGGTSGLIYSDGFLWTVNDHSVLTLFKLDTMTGAVVGTLPISEKMPVDMEEVQHDNRYLYLGDLGNNCGCRTDLHILKVDKQSLNTDSPVVDTIAFFYPDQMLFSSDHFSTDYDCEAFVIRDDSIFLFTKQWTSLGTACYTIPNIPGVHAAEFRYSVPINGLVTGAAINPTDGSLALIGYSNTMRPFLCFLSEWKNGSELNVMKSYFPELLSQKEAIAFDELGNMYVTNELFTVSSLLKIPPRLLRLKYVK